MASSKVLNYAGIQIYSTLYARCLRLLQNTHPCCFFLLVFKLVGRDEIGSSTCETCQVFMRIWKKLKISPITLLGPAFVKFGRQNLLQTNTPESKASKGWADCSSVSKSREQNLCLTRNTNLKSPISYIAAMYANSPKSAKGLKRSKEHIHVLAMLEANGEVKAQTSQIKSMSTQQESLISDSHTLPNLKASIKSIPVNAAV